jgi:hypothetical protein
MKKPYNEDWMRARVIHARAETWYRRGLLSAERLAAIKTEFPDGFYRANVWVKIALFLFTLLLNGCAGSLSGVLIWPLFDSSPVGAGLVGVAFGVGFFVLLDVLIRERRLFHSGIDNAMLYTAVAAVVGGVWLVALPVADERLYVYGLLALPVLSYAVLRYASRLLTLALLACLLFTLARLALLVPTGLLVLPFLGMAVAGGVYVFVKNAQRDDAHFYWLDCLTVAEIAALVVFYGCANAYVVAWGNALLSGQTALPFAGMFYVLTALVPLAFLFFGLRKRDRRLLIVGLLATGASVLTFQVMAFHLPWGLFLALGGAVLIAVSWGFIRRLDPDRAGYTSLSGKRRQPSTAEALTTTEFPQLPQPDAPTGPLFGGGSFGGGGAGVGY